MAVERLHCCADRGGDEGGRRKGGLSTGMLAVRVIADGELDARPRCSKRNLPPERQAFDAEDTSKPRR